MSFGNTDSEADKPNWLTEEERRNVVRTIRGWELPLKGAASWNVGNTGSTGISSLTPNGLSGGAGGSYRSAVSTVPMELLVCLPHRLSTTGVTPSNFIVDRRGATQAGPGYTGSDTPNYKPYITWPVHGSTITQPFGTTSYFPIIAADANTTDAPWTLAISLTGTASLWAVAGGPTASFASMTADTVAGGGTCFSTSTGVTGTYARNRGFGGLTNAAVPFRSPGQNGISGNYTVTATVTDRGGLTGVSTFTLSITGS